MKPMRPMFFPMKFEKMIITLDGLRDDLRQQCGLWKVREKSLDIISETVLKMVAEGLVIPIDIIGNLPEL